MYRKFIAVLKYLIRYSNCNVLIFTTVLILFLFSILSIFLCIIKNSQQNNLQSEKFIQEDNELTKTVYTL